MPESLKAKPAKCTPGQITQCHGDGEEHPCIEADKHARAIVGQGVVCFTISESPVLLLFGLEHFNIFCSHLGRREDEAGKEDCTAILKYCE